MLKIKSFNANKLCNVLLGLFNPFKHEIPEYQKYDITKLKDHCRFLEVILNRGGSSGGIVGLYFDGATCNWAELPKPDSREIHNVYSFIEELRRPSLVLLVHGVINFIKNLYSKF